MEKRKMLRVRNISYRYPDGTGALSGVSFECAEGEKTAIVGPNGAGKSTLLLSLNGIVRARGEIEIAGRRLTDGNGDLRGIRKKVGLVFQDPDDQIFSPTVFEDVAFGPLNFGFGRDEARRMAEEAMREADIEGFGERSPFHLSFGEKKRVAIAGALAARPEILLLDEPTANLDPGHRRKMIGWLKSFRGTLIVSGHDLDMLLEVTDRAVILNRGRVVKKGPAGKILADKVLLESNSLELPLSLQETRVR